MPEKNKVKSNSVEGNLQLFTSKIDFAIGKCSILFQIHLEGIIPEYCYNPCDPLAKEQLWSTVKSKLLVNVEFIVQNKRFAAHKAILAARSSVFKAEFAREYSKKDCFRIQDFKI